MKKFALLISLLTSLTSFAADSNFEYSGFVYNTTFGDSGWQKGRTTAALNLDYFYDNFAARTQLSTYQDNRVRRAVLEYSHPIGSSVEMVYQVGRFTRLDSFYDGITDSPSNYRQAVLPFAGYSYRMFNGAFVLEDGLNAKAVYKTHAAVYSVKASSGKMVVPNQYDIQMEAFKRTFDGLQVKGKNNNYDVSAHVETKEWHGYVQRNQYMLDTTTNGSATANYAHNLVANIDYRLDRVGLQWTDNKYLAQTEWFHDITNMFNPKDTPTVLNNAVGVNGLLGYHVNDDWLTYIGRSYARNKIAGSHNSDSYIGATWAKNAWTVSGEFHKGDGFAWRKYDAVYYPSNQVPTWNTWVLSTTYRL